MNVDDIVKLVLVFALSGSMVGISWQIARLVGKLADSVQDLRHAIQNVSTASDMVLEDYEQIRKLLHTILDVVENLEQNILSPLRVVTAMLQRFSGSQPSKNKKTDSL